MRIDLDGEVWRAWRERQINKRYNRAMIKAAFESTRAAYEHWADRYWGARGV